MKRLLLIISLSILCEVSSLAQNIVWNWVPNPQAGNENSLYPYPIGEIVYTSPEYPIDSIPIDMNGDGTVDFEFRAISIGPTVVEVLQHNANEVLATTVPPPDIGEVAVALNTADQVSSLTPVGAEWLTKIAAGPEDPYDIGAMLDSQFSVDNQYTDQRGYIGVAFHAADGLHYGALEVIGIYDPTSEYSGNNMGILYGYGYNPVPGAPFNLSDIPRMPVPEPSTRALLSLGSLCVWMLRLKH